jgi:hypothetical protein
VDGLKAKLVMAPTGRSETLQYCCTPDKAHFSFRMILPKAGYQQGVPRTLLQINTDAGNMKVKLMTAKSESDRTKDPEVQVQVQNDLLKYKAEFKAQNKQLEECLGEHIEALRKLNKEVEKDLMALKESNKELGEKVVHVVGYFMRLYHKQRVWSYNVNVPFKQTFTATLSNLPKTSPSFFICSFLIPKKFIKMLTKSWH